MKIKEEIECIFYEIKRVPSHIREYIEFLCRWLSYFKVLRKTYDFDYSSILAVEKHQISRVRDAIIHYRNHVNWKRDVEKMNLALSLLEIIEKDGEIEMINENECFSCEDDKPVWRCNGYINTRNSYRFNKHIAKKLSDLSDTDNYKEILKNYLRVEKAWYLYYKLRRQYTRDWWD